MEQVKLKIEKLLAENPQTTVRVTAQGSVSVRIEVNVRDGMMRVVCVCMREDKESPF